MIGTLELVPWIRKTPSEVSYRLPSLVPLTFLIYILIHFKTPYYIVYELFTVEINNININI